MPTTPQPGDPTYENWLQMANSYGMTVDELYQAMVSYPAEQGAGANYPTRPVPPPPVSLTPGPILDPSSIQSLAQKKNEVLGGGGAPATAIGMYQGQSYDPGSPWNIPSALAWGAEQVASESMKVRVNWMQNDMNDAHKGLANAKAANSPIETKFYTDRILQLRTDYQSLLQEIQTGATGYRAAQRAATSGMYLSGYEGLKSEVPQGFDMQAPLVLAEPEGIVPGYETPTTTTAAASTGAPKEGDFGTFGAVAPKEGDFGTFGKTGDFGTFGAPASLTRGGYSYTPPGMPTEGLATPYRGPYPSAGNIPEGGGAGDIVETPGGRGFASFAALQEGMGDDWQPWLRDQYTGAVIRGGTNMIRGSAGQLREQIGDTTPFGYYRGGRDTGYYDLGQGEQKYIIRRDGMGNIRSFTPASSGQMPWDRFVSSG